MKIPFKKIFASIITGLIIISAIFTITFTLYFGKLCKDCGVGKFRSFSVDAYNNFASQNEIMPTTDEIGNYTKLTTEEYIHLMPFMDKEVYILNVQYETSEYQKQKEILYTKYIYQTDFINQEYAELPEIFPSFLLGGYVFKTLSLENYNLTYPKQLYFIGTSDATREIIYISFSDIDLDYVYEQFNDFLKHECDWKHFNKIKKSS